MTEAETLDLANRLLVLSGMIMEDESVELVTTARDSVTVETRGQKLQETAEDFAAIARCVLLLSRLSAKSS